ncbi:MAG TPA: CDP-glycerol--poly(glycerophosphate) glycerophosphotransferase [Coprothermobacter proteolyticus]|uniref:CDP-Glycerol:Poly(Glycerophosphate) glycerophosphotransferase family protein n=2 Tax=Coprothermobacter TaxID=68335 RepID=B5Y9F5_COPPD|nr:CDP-glycerol--poly(glycerophosphate) glycerophosphotransferase [Coprothermobacter proteolyticus]HPO83667.1 CDP-glycerol--poly(glycerophosphate) glycerophosphotransferase [Coprothermobacter proteolyticus]
MESRIKPEPLETAGKGISVYSDMQIGFLCTTPFHYYLFEPVKKLLSNSNYVLVESNPRQYRSAREFFRDRHVFDAVENPQVIKDFDVLVCPFLMPLVYKENQEKIFVRMVYGLSKATWNYGWWNMLFDEFLVYGNYDAKILSFYGPTVKIGNPKFDDWFNGNVEPYPVEPNKKTILYLPTYDDLSTLSWVLPVLSKMAENFNVILKTHHGTNASELKKVFSRVEILGGDVDILPLLASADVVVSDYSGAIFDAILAEKPLVLADIPGAETFPSTTPSSLEHVVRNYALHTSDQALLRDYIVQALEEDPYLEKRKEVAQEWFAVRDGTSGQRAAQAIVNAQKDQREEKRFVQKALLTSTEFNKDLYKKKAERFLGKYFSWL